jgi:hypothetical protein
MEDGGRAAEEKADTRSSSGERQSRLSKRWTML